MPLSHEMEEPGGLRILVTRLKYLGDVVLTLPVVDALRERFPGAEIDYLTKKDGWELLSKDPRFSAVYLYPDGGPVGVMRLLAELRKRKYFLALDLLSDPRSAIVTYLCGARRRVGGSRRIRKHFYTDPVEVPTSIRAATGFHLYHLTVLGVESRPRKPVLSISAQERGAAARFLESMEADTWPGIHHDGPRVGLHPGAKWEVKRWPEEHFAGLGNELIERVGARIFVMHGPGEERMAERVARSIGPGAALLPLLSLRKLAAVLSLLDCAVLCDGGPMHVSVAVGTPTVGIFGSSEPEIWFPYEQFGPYRASRVPIQCRPCHTRECSHLSCLKNLSIEMVAEDALRVLRASTHTL